MENAVVVALRTTHNCPVIDDKHVAIILKIYALCLYNSTTNVYSIMFIDKF